MNEKFVDLFLLACGDNTVHVYQTGQGWAGMGRDGRDGRDGQGREGREGWEGDPGGTERHRPIGGEIAAG